MKSYMMKELNLRLKNTIVDDVIVSDMDRFSKEDINTASQINVVTNDVGFITIQKSLLNNRSNIISDENTYFDNLALYIDTIHDIYKAVYTHIGKNVDLEDMYGLDVFSVRLERSMEDAFKLDVILDDEILKEKIYYPSYSEDIIDYFKEEFDTIKVNINCNIANKFAKNFEMVEEIIKIYPYIIGRQDGFLYNQNNGVAVLQFGEDFIQFKLDTFFKDPKIIEKIYFSEVKFYKKGMKIVDDSKYDLKKSLNHYLKKFEIGCHVESIDDKKVKITSNSKIRKFSFFIEPRLHDDGLGFDLIKTLIKYSYLIYNKTFIENKIDHIYSMKVTHSNNMNFNTNDSLQNDNSIEIVINDKIKKTLISDENPILYKYMQVYGKDQIDEWNKYLAELNK